MHERSHFLGDLPLKLSVNAGLEIQRERRRGKSPQQESTGREHRLPVIIA